MLIRRPLRPILKKFTQQKQEREKKDVRKDESRGEEPKIALERKDEVENEDDHGKEMEENKDDKAHMDIEVEESGRTIKKPKFLKSPFQIVIPKKRSKGKKALVVVEDDDDKREKKEEKELVIAYTDTRTSVDEL
ncbi:uncharacterized protein A4U43_C02F6820 [Asparagus officinalis]|uniref:Uncharacterized protein n=1 Tax=Asparagus officinalis TaxID=4686 RepID=A0A5P1FJ97_ASPOF|nr:uncharacterized protein A4U43_C02F6820 [Asparagus officinalis]